MDYKLLNELVYNTLQKRLEQLQFSKGVISNLKGDHIKLDSLLDAQIFEVNHMIDEIENAVDEWARGNQ